LTAAVGGIVPEKPRRCTALVEAVRLLTSDVIEVDLRMQEPPEFAFDAGQWVSVPFGPKIVRAYSIASTPLSRRVITLCADVAPGGVGSQWMRSLSDGATVEFKGPTGGFVFSRSDTRRPLFVAEEIGIVPIRSILTELYTTGFGRPATLIQWGRDSGWLVYAAEFRSLARRYPAFSYFPVVREAPAGWRGDKGEPPAVVDRLVHSVDRLVAYVCGGEATIKAVRQVLTAKGLDRKSVKWEKFW
jgi:Na+-transporting NADH:ubiquinone oxidoreductase subunit F